jgi:hypothetical protein
MQGETNVQQRTFLSPVSHAWELIWMALLAMWASWAEAGMFFPEREIVMTTDCEPIVYGQPAGTVTNDSILLKKEPYVRFVVGG